MNFYLVDIPLSEEDEEYIDDDLVHMPLLERCDDHLTNLMELLPRALIDIAILDQSEELIVINFDSILSYYGLTKEQFTAAQKEMVSRRKTLVAERKELWNPTSKSIQDTSKP